MPKGKGKQPEETKKASEQDSNVAEMLELSYRELNYLYCIWRALMGKVDNFQEEMGYVNKSDYTCSQDLPA